MTAFEIQRIRIYVYQAPAEPPIRSSFGLIKERSALIVAIDDHDGYTGWGEIWSGLPAFGAHHRAKLLEKLISPQLIGKSVSDPAETGRRLAQSLMPVVRLAGEAGPVSQVLAGLDCALWDLMARRAAKPLCELLGLADPAPTIAVYASGIAPQVTRAELDRMRSQGFTAFKLKAGFDDAAVLPEIVRAGKVLERDETMMIDANCGWEVEAAISAVRFLADTPLEFVEEPMGPECPAEDWARFQAACPHPVAAGENLLRLADFHQAFDWLDVIQPDLGKWGGISEVVPLARRARAAGLRYCPHTFGTYIGAAHAAHVLAAVGGDGRLELDINPNPLRHVGEFPLRDIRDGRGELTAGPGIGLEVELDALAPFLCQAVIVQADSL